MKTLEIMKFCLTIFNIRYLRKDEEGHRNTNLKIIKHYMQIGNMNNLKPIYNLRYNINVI